MYSIVIPTMWRAQSLKHMLRPLDNHPLVGEILLINNDPYKTPAWLHEKWNKLHVANFGKNIYVNPAWNVGVESAKFEHICLMNDDIQFDTVILHYISDKLDPENGVIGPKYHVYPPLLKPEDMNVTTIDYSSANHMGERYGTLMFLNKANWSHIDDGLLIWEGDTWIFEHHVKIGKKPRLLHNARISVEKVNHLSRGVTTASPEWDNIRSSDTMRKSMLIQSGKWAN